MAVVIYPITPSFAAEIGDVDLSCPIGPSDLAAVNEAFAHYAVLIFPDQHLSQDQHLDFARHFGPLETTIALYRKDEALRLRPEFADVSNLNHESKVWGEESRQRLFQLGNRLWHTDSSFKRLPARASLLYARSIPPVGGHTEFADERAAYDALPEETRRRLEGLVAEHSIFNSRARLGFTNFSDEERQAMPPVPQLLVRSIPESGRKSLYLASHAGRILGCPSTTAARSSTSLSRTQRNANSSIRIAGGFMIWSSGTIAAPCTGELISTICAGSATCSARPFPTSRTRASRKASLSRRRSKLSRPRPLAGMERPLMSVGWLPPKVTAPPREWVW